MENLKSQENNDTMNDNNLKLNKEKVSLDEVKNLQVDYYKNQQTEDNESLDDLNIANLEETYNEFILILEKTDSNNASLN